MTPVTKLANYKYDPSNCLHKYLQLLQSGVPQR